jgi:hypothetical protein
VSKPVAYLYDFPNPDNPKQLVRNWTAHSMDEVRMCGGINVRPLYLHPKPGLIRSGIVWAIDRIELFFIGRV